MVCKECGAYNAEHLTHCRVCAAKLKDGDNIEMEDNSILDEQPAAEKPSKKFAKAPTWPSGAFEGADKTVSELDSDDNSVADTISDETKIVTERKRPDFLFGNEENSIKTNKKKSTSVFVQDDILTCPQCGKQLIEGAPFCPFCGTKLQTVGTKSTENKSAQYRLNENDMFSNDLNEFEEDKFDSNDSVLQKKPSKVTVAKKKNSKHDFEEENDDFDDFDDEYNALPKSVKEKKSKIKNKKKHSFFEEDDELEEYEDEVEPEEESEKIFMAKNSRSSKKQKSQNRYDDDYDEEEYEEDDDEEYDDDYYDQEFDDDEERPPKKGNTILFIILIVVLVALLAVFGTIFVNKKYGGFKNLISGKGTSSPEPVQSTSDSNNMTPVSSDGVNATIEGDEVDGVEMFIITVQAPNGSQVKLITNAELENDTVTVQQDNQVALRVPRVVFLPGDDDYDSTTVTVLPQLQVTLPDGTVKDVYVPASTVTIPQVSLTLTQPESTTIESTPDGSPIEIKGYVTDHTVNVTINDQNVQVLEGGEFTYEYKPANANNETVNIVAKKVNCMPAVQTITITPFVVKDAEITVTSTLGDLRATDGSVTIQGTISNGASLTASCSKDGVTCDEPVITDSTFACKVSVPSEGVYEITLTGSGEGYNENSVTCLVERTPATKSSSKYKAKALDAKKNYDKLVSGSATDTSLTFKGTVKEIVSAEGAPYTIFIMEDSKGNSCYVANRSDKAKVDANKVGKKMEVAGFNNGLYPGTSNPYIWAWFIWNK